MNKTFSLTLTHILLGTLLLINVTALAVWGAWQVFDDGGTSPAATPGDAQNPTPNAHPSSNAVTALQPGAAEFSGSSPTPSTPATSAPSPELPEPTATVPPAPEPTATARAVMSSPPPTSTPTALPSPTAVCLDIQRYAADITYLNALVEQAIRAGAMSPGQYSLFVVPHGMCVSQCDRNWLDTAVVTLERAVANPAAFSGGLSPIPRKLCQ